MAGVDVQERSKGKNVCSKRRRSSGESVKVVYISTPMKVKTSASRFRSLVQELTGRDSDLSRFDDIDNFNDIAAAAGATVNYSEVVDVPSAHDDHSLTSSDDSLLLDDVFSSDMLERLEGMFPSSMFFDHSLINVPTNY